MDEAPTNSDSASDDRTVLLGPDLDGPIGGISRSQPEPDIGGIRGRYVVLGTLGRGAMGRVLRAYDPTLQREVALKLVSAKVLEPHARERMLREAQAMAQLSHPNVVGVFDVEQSDTELALVMEYVPGQTLKRWVNKERPSWPEVVARYVDAGRGLAAAHAAGLLHRDFKPENVLISDDGTVKVTDFGLAKLSSTDSRSLTDDGHDSAMPSSSTSSGTLDVALTQAGTVMGTPRYMAPEQHAGAPLEPSVDQYAFCISLWEALTGAAPYRAKTLEDIYAQKQSGAPSWPSKAPPIPRRVLEALRRGLQAEPHERWPGMEALIEVLCDDPRQRRTRWLTGLVGGGLLLAAAGGWWAWSHARAQRCTGAAEHLVGAWDDAQHKQVRAAMLGLGASFTEAVWERTETRLDHYADTWVTMHVETCEATTVRGEQSPAVMDLRMACLQHAQLGLEAVTQLLGEADVEVVRHASDILEGLPRLARCADVEGLLKEVEPPRAEDAEAVKAIRKRLAEATAALQAGRYERAHELVEQAKATLPTIEYEPVQAEVTLEEGIVLVSLGRYDEAEAALRTGMQTAARWHRLDLMEELAEELILVVGYHQRRTSEGRQLWEMTLGLALEDPLVEASARNVYAGVLSIEGKFTEAEAEYRHSLELQQGVAEPDDLEVAVLRSNIGLVLNEQGRYSESEAELRQALAVMGHEVGPTHPTVGMFHNNLANSLLFQGKYDEAEAELQIALEIQEAALGPEHPDVALAINNLAQLLYRKGEYDEAERRQRDALGRQERAFEPGHADIGQSHSNLGNILHGLGRYAEAEQEFRRALPILEATLGPDHPTVAQTRSNLGLILHERGSDDEAEVELRQALARWERSLGPEHPNVGIARNNLALVLYERKQYGEAAAEYRRVIASWEVALGPEHPNLATAHNNLSQVLHEQGKLAEAETELRRSLEIAIAALGPEHSDVARAHHNLGMVLFERKRPEDADAEVRQALALWKAALGSEHPNVAIARHSLAKIMLSQGRPEDAARLAEEVLERRMQDDGLASARAATAFVLARALWAIGERAGQARARALAEQATGWFEQAEDDEAKEDVRAWLADPRGWTPRGKVENRLP